MSGRIGALKTFGSGCVSLEGAPSAPMMVTVGREAIAKMLCGLVAERDLVVQRQRSQKQKFEASHDEILAWRRFLGKVRLVPEVTVLLLPSPLHCATLKYNHFSPNITLHCSTRPLADTQDAQLATRTPSKYSVGRVHNTIVQPSPCRVLRQVARTPDSHRKRQSATAASQSTERDHPSRTRQR